MWAGIWYGLACCFTAICLSAPYLSWRALERVAGAAKAPMSWARIALIAAVLAWGTKAAVGFGAFYQAHGHASTVQFHVFFDILWYHVELLVLCSALVVTLAWRIWNRRLNRAGIVSAGGIGAAAASAIALIMTVPSGGDESVLLWVILVPLFGLVSLLLIVCGIVTIKTGNRLKPEIGHAFPVISPENLKKGETTN